MKTYIQTRKTKILSCIRSVAVFTAALVLFGVSTAPVKAQDPADELITAIAPLLQSLINANVVDALDVPANPSPRDVANVIKEGISHLTTCLNGGPIPVGVDPHQLVTALRNILAGGSTSVENLSTFLYANAPSGNEGELLDTARDVLNDTCDLVFSLDEEVVLPAPLIELSLNELIFWLQSIVDNTGLQSNVGTLFTTILQTEGGLAPATILTILTAELGTTTTQTVETAAELLSFMSSPPPPGSSGIIERPDLMAGDRPGAGTGDDIYGTGRQIHRGRHQVRKNINEKIRHYFSLQNDGLVTSDFRTQGNMRSHFFQIQAFNNGRNVTASLQAGTQSNTINPDGVSVFTIYTKAKRKLRARGKGRLLKHTVARIGLRTTAPDGAEPEFDYAFLKLRTRG